MTAPNNLGVNVWYVPRESTEWCGPIEVTLTSRATGQPVDQHVTFALMPRGQRPADSDFATPHADPDGTTAVGVFLNPVDTRSSYGIWARDEDNPESPWLEPESVGFIERS